MNQNIPTTQNAQPKALYLLVFVQMWECFSFYGMRALLVLYMLKELEFSDLKAFGVYAVYTGLVELGGVVGGYIADTSLGLRRAITLGGLLMTAGHLVLGIGSAITPFYFGLALIIVGCSLYSTNITALLGLYYQENDPKREEGFTLFYIGINIGGFLASILCGIVGEVYGWHYGFGLAAIGMLVGCIALYAFGRVLEGKGNPPASRTSTIEGTTLTLLIPATIILACFMAFSESLMTFLPWLCLIALGYVIQRVIASKMVSLTKVFMLLIYLGALALFYAANEQIGSTLVVFSERMANATFFGVTIPSTVILAINPLTIILFGSMMTRIFRRLKQPKSSSKVLHFSSRVVYAFVMAFAAFACLAFTCFHTTNNDGIPMTIVLGSVFLISFSELLIGPFVYSYCSEIATKSQQAIVMSLVPIGFSLANFLAGFFSQMMAIPDGAADQSMTIYGEGFMSIAFILAGAALLLGLGLPILARILNRKPPELSIE